jgi:hypothetical protein
MLYLNEPGKLSKVIIIWARRQANRSPIPGRDRDFSLRHHVQTDSGALAALSWEPGLFFGGGNWPRHAADCSPPSCAECYVLALRNFAHTDSYNEPHTPSFACRSFEIPSEQNRRSRNKSEKRASPMNSHFALYLRVCFGRFCFSLTVLFFIPNLIMAGVEENIWTEERWSDGRLQRST